MKKYFVIVLLSAFVVIINSCSNGIVDPEPQAGRRDYVWTKDTLRADPDGFQFLTSIWGSSPNDVWVVGDAATYLNKVWHYDGVKWKNYLLDQYAEPIRIYGISSNEIWMVTAQSDIWKYDGTKWYKHTTIVPAGYKRILFEDIYGYANNIYAVGIAEKADGDYTGIIVHYDGYKWQVIPTPQIKEYFLYVLFINGKDILIVGTTFYDSNESYRLYKLQNRSLSLVQKNKIDYRIGILNNRVYVNTNRKVYSYDDGSLTEAIDLTGTDYAGGIVGRSIKDFFSANYGWNLGHYDGTDMVNIFPAGGYIIDGKVFEDDIYFICRTLDSKNYILHGKLK